MKAERISMEDSFDGLYLLYLVSCQEDPDLVITPIPIRISSRETDTPFCGICRISFKSMKGLKQHEGKAHPTKERSISCPECSKAFYHKHALKFHMNQVHLKATRQNCPSCFKSFYNKYSLQQHFFKCKSN